MKISLLCRVLFCAAALAIATGCQSSPKEAKTSGPWDLEKLSQAPKVSWGVKSNLVQQLYYEGEPLQGKPTQVFAYLGRPNDGKGRHPGIVLVHGGGGKAFRDWAEHWARRGYVALSMDLSGNGPDGKRLPDGAPDQSDQTKFREFTSNDISEMWTYHAVADVIRGHSLLASLPEVEADNIALTGISWGGYLTCIVAGLDHRFKAAVPVYGCGFLGDNSVWKDGSLARLSPESRALWLKTFDPSQYLSGVRSPILFLNGSHDFAYPFDSYQKSYRLVKPDLRYLSVVMKLPHGHIWSFPEVDQFIDRALAKKSFPEIAELKLDGNKVKTKATSELKSAELNFTSNTGPWQQRVWKTTAAKINGAKIEAELPEGTPMVWFMTGVTKDDLRISSEYSER